MKVGILAQDFTGWSGGLDFLSGVIDSLLSTPRAEQTEFHLLIPDSGPRLSWRRFKRRVRDAISGKAPPPQFAPSPELVLEAFAPFADRISIRHIDVGRGARRRTAKRLGFDVVLPGLHPLGNSFPCPWLGYAYDFQHKYFPQNLGPESCRSRDEHFNTMLRATKAVIVNSRAVAADIKRFIPHATARVFALPFSAAPQPDWLKEIPGVPARYDITGPFFIISNQFWVHKDHATAFNAFRIIAGERPELSLVCTGSTIGAGDPSYFPGLTKNLENWGLDKRVRILGLIPKRDQIELMKNACAIIQPTLFEGGPGGGCIYDAVAVDAPAIITDIPVNREIESDRVVFFPPGNSEALAREMNAHLEAPRQKSPPNVLLSAGRHRRAACGEALWQAIDFVLGTE